MLSLRNRIILAAVLGLGTFLLLPAGLIASSTGPLNAASCHGDVGDITPPGDEFFAALSRLQTAAHFPGFNRPATRRANEAVISCTRGLAAACSIKRDAALELALENLRYAGWRTEDPEAPVAEAWRSELDDEARNTLCESWTPWLEYLEESQVPAGGLCPVCEPGGNAPTANDDPPV